MMLSVTRCECASWLHPRVACHARPCFVYQIRHWKNFRSSRGAGIDSASAASGCSRFAPGPKRLSRSALTSAHSSANSRSVRSRNSRSKRRAMVQCQLVPRGPHARAPLELSAAASTTSFHSCFSDVARFDLLVSAGIGVISAEVDIGVASRPRRLHRLLDRPLNLCGREAIPIHTRPDVCIKSCRQHWRRYRRIILVLVGSDLLGHG